jgi:predicted DNA-binding transcriptional regulator
LIKLAKIVWFGFIYIFGCPKRKREIKHFQEKINKFVEKLNSIVRGTEGL